MVPLLIVLLVLVLALFGLASISQSYASAQQAQATIEAGRAAQIASAGNLVTILVIAVLVVFLLVALAVIAYLVYRLKFETPAVSGKGFNATIGYVSQPSASEMLPAMMTMLMLQFMRQQTGMNRQSNQQFLFDELQGQPLALDDAQPDDDFWRV